MKYCRSILYIILPLYLLVLPVAGSLAQPDVRADRKEPVRQAPSGTEVPGTDRTDHPQSRASEASGLDPSVSETSSSAPEGIGLKDGQPGQPDAGRTVETPAENRAPEKSKSNGPEKSISRWLMYNGWRVGLIVVLAAMALFATNSFSRFLQQLFTRDKEGTEIKKRAHTMSSAVRYVLIVVIILIAGMMILKEIDVDIGPILAGAGVLGLAVGFGAQNLVKDVISGFFILMEDQIRVGDVVTLADKTGYVEKVTLRMVVLRDIGGNVHYIPSGEITLVTNKTKNFSRYLFEISVAYKEDIDEVIEVMKEIDQGLRSDPKFSEFILEPLEVLGLDRFDASGMIIRARTKTIPNKQWKVGREFNKRLKKKFDEVGIEIPFPHLTLYPGESKSGEPPAFHVVYKSDAIR